MDNNHNDNNINNYNNNNINNEEERKEIYQIILNKLNKNKNMINNNNNNNLQPNNLENENNVEDEDEYEEDLNKEKVEEKNFAQQVDFLYHPNDPEDQSSIKNILIKQYKKQKKIIPKEEQSKKVNNNKKVTKNPKRPKSNYNIINKKQIIPYLNKNKGLFDPYLTQKELDYESKIKKEREEKQRKIDEYEKNKSRKKLEEDINKRIINYAIPKMKPLIKAKNFEKKKVKKKDEDLIKHFVQVPKPRVKKKLAENLGFNPKKYDAIINSLLDEINQVKNERKKENEMFKKQLQLYTKDNVDKYNNYYEFLYKKQKLNYDNKFRNYKTINNNNNNKPTRGQIINGLMKKYFGKDTKGNKVDTITEDNLKKEKKSERNNNKSNDVNTNINKNKVMNNNYINNINDLLSNNQENINNINFDNIDKLLSSENITFQDKINILSELNKNLDNYYKDMPEFVQQIQTSLNKLYENEYDPNNFRKEVNKVPYIAMASKVAYQIIQTNNYQIIEKIIDELLYDCTCELNIIDQKKKKLKEKEQLINELDKAKNKINIDLPKKEEEIINKLNAFLQQKEEELQNKINNDINNQKKNVEIVKFRGELDNNFISERYKYKDEFKNYMIFKGSFYYNGIFDIYDQFVEEEADNIANKIIDNYVDELHRQAQRMANNEMNNIEGK